MRCGVPGTAAGACASDRRPGMSALAPRAATPARNLRLGEEPANAAVPCPPSALEPAPGPSFLPAAASLMSFPPLRVWLTYGKCLPAGPAVTQPGGGRPGRPERFSGAARAPPRRLERE